MASKFLDGRTWTVDPANRIAGETEIGEVGVPMSWGPVLRLGGTKLPQSPTLEGLPRGRRPTIGLGRRAGVDAATLETRPTGLPLQA